MIKNGMRPVHPGEILFEEFMKPADPPINANMLAKALEVPANRITAIIKGQRGITGDTGTADCCADWGQVSPFLNAMLKKGTPWQVVASQPT